MLHLYTEATFKPGGPLPCEFTSENLPQGFIPECPYLDIMYKESGDSVFSVELSIGIIGISEIVSHASYPHVHELLQHAEQSFRRIPSLRTWNKMC